VPNEWECRLSNFGLSKLIVAANNDPYELAVARIHGAKAGKVVEAVHAFVQGCVVAVTRSQGLGAPVRLRKGANLFLDHSAGIHFQSPEPWRSA
jgi:hypothetical protein